MSLTKPERKIRVHNRAKRTTVVDRKFLRDLAESIYSPKNRTFLRLCDGTLQNGPDPTDEERPMHCGLGELYYAMTGVQPELTGVDEEQVVELALELSPLNGLREKAKQRAKDAIRAAGLPEALESSLLDAIDSSDEDLDWEDTEEDFKDVLNEIPDRNDDGCGHDADCSVTQFRDRSKRVAEQLRKAADLLPRPKSKKR